MLNSNFMFSYYAFIQSYWQKRLNASKYNIEAAFAQSALTLVWQHKEREDSATSQALLDAELKAQDNYIYTCQKQRAGLAGQDEVNEALAKMNEARTERRTSLPDYEWLVGAIHTKAQETFRVFNDIRDKLLLPFTRFGPLDIKAFLAGGPPEVVEEYKKYTDWIVKAQALRDSATTFQSQVKTFLEVAENELDAIGETQTAPRTYQDIIDESTYTFTGAYSDEANHISPEGPVTGQLQVLLQVLHRIYWDGSNWMEMPDELDQCASPDMLPAVAEEGVIFRIPDPNETKESAYYYRYESKWLRMPRMSDVDGWANLPSMGHVIGSYHIVSERNVPTIWDGYEKVRLPHSALQNDVPGMHMPPGFVAKVDTIDSGQSQLVSDFMGFREATDGNLGELDRSVGRVIYRLEEINSDGVITLPEANSLKLSLQLLDSESLQLLSMGGTLGITSEVNTYSAAVDAVSELLAAYVDRPAYPIEVSAAERAQITQKFRAVQDAKSALVNAIAEAQAAGAYSDASFDLSEFRQVYNGFVRGFTPEFELIFVSETELSLRPRYNDFDYLTISEQNIQASKRTSVFTFTPVLNWNEEAQELYYSTLQPSTDYYVYLANRDAGFNLNVYDYRGRLFCSDTEPSSNYFGEAGLGLKAILIGTCRTNSATRFLHELDVSLVSRQSDMRETFREFSDFDLVYVDEDTLRLQRIYGTYGQIYVPESLYYLGENREVYTSSSRITFDPDTGLLGYESGSVSNNTLYFVYIAADSDIYNFNDLNPATSRPWHPEDVGSSDTNEETGLPFYRSEKDFRLGLFLCTQPPDEGRLSQTYYGFWARHVGQVRTDGVGKFTFSSNISAIRQATLSPEYFDGLAEISIENVSQNSFKVVRKRGTSGILIVNGAGIQAYDANELEVHTIRITDAVYAYDETEPVNFLTDTGDDLNKYILRPVYLYIANNRSDLWGALASRTFLCLTAPSGGYLSGNHPGSSARYIATVRPAAGVRGVELVTNGIFNGSTGWNTNGGWTVSAEDQNCAHTVGNTAQLEQSAMSVQADQVYEVIISVVSCSTGSVTPALGGVNGAPITGAGIFKQHIRTTGTAPLAFRPTSNADHVLDNVSCSLVQGAQFTGAFISDSILGSNVSVDDTIVSTTQTWTSARIMEEILSYFATSGLNGIWNTQKVYGLPLVLEYVDATRVKLRALNTTATIVFPDLSVRQIDTSGITLTVSGAPNTRYYVYLDSSSLYMSTTPPDGLYTALETRGTTAVQVGDICLATQDAMSGDWNVCSSHNEEHAWVHPMAQPNNGFGPFTSYMSPATHIPVSRRCDGTAFMDGAVEFEVKNWDSYGGGYWTKTAIYNGAISGRTIDIEMYTNNYQQRAIAHGTVALFPEGVSDQVVEYVSYTDAIIVTAYNIDVARVKSRNGVFGFRRKMKS